MKITKRKVQKDQYEVECSQCGKKIIGNSEANILYNLNIHINAIHKNIKGEPKLVKDLAKASSSPTEDKIE